MYAFPVEHRKIIIISSFIPPLELALKRVNNNNTLSKTLAAANA
jgi:hypothetical protein